MLEFGNWFVFHGSESTTLSDLEAVFQELNWNQSDHPSFKSRGNVFCLKLSTYN